MQKKKRFLFIGQLSFKKKKYETIPSAHFMFRNYGLWKIFVFLILGYLL